MGGDDFCEMIVLTDDIVNDIREGSDLLIHVAAEWLQIQTERRC